MILCLADAIFIGVWAFIGSVLGFFAFSNTPNKSLSYRFGRCLLSISIGLFIAFPLCEYLQELGKFSKNLNIMLGGLGAFGLPDFILKYWPKITNAAVTKVVDRAIDNGTSYCCERQHDDEE